MVALLLEDPPQASDVGVVELAVPGRGAFRIEQALALEETDLRDGHVRELVPEELEHFADREEGAVGHVGHDPLRKTSLNRPIWSSSPLVSGASLSIRSRLR